MDNHGVVDGVVAVVCIKGVMFIGEVIKECVGKDTIMGRGIRIKGVTLIDVATKEFIPEADEAFPEIEGMASAGATGAEMKFSNDNDVLFIDVAIIASKCEPCVPFDAVPISPPLDAASVAP